MYNDNWTANFLKDKLAEHHNIDSIVIENKNLATLSRKNGVPFLTFTMALESINHPELKEILDSNESLDFIVNIKKDYKIDGESLDILYSEKVSFGGMGDLMRFANQEDNSFYTDQEFYFVSRGLEQHDKVTSIKRLDNKRIKIERNGIKEVIIVMNNDYELNADSVRTHKSKFIDFQVMLSTNPNAQISSDAIEVAKSINIDLCQWGEFSGKLNTSWK